MSAMTVESRTKLLALDTEDDSNGHPGILNFYDGRRHTTFEGRELQLHAWNWLCEQGPCHVWACNLEYDLINLCGVWVGKMITLQYVTPGLMRAFWRRSRGVQFFDTLRHWPMSVEQMGRYIGLPKYRKDFTSVRYCRRDTAIVWRFVAQMLQRYEADELRLRATLPSMALQLFKRFWPSLPVVDEATRAWFRRGYYGGRVEVYRFREIEGPVHHYDVNSLFPTAMRNGTYPDLDAPWKETTAPDFAREGMVEATVRIPLTRYPGLPVRDAGELVYPYGTVRGVWPYPEVRALIEEGGAVREVHRALEYAAMPVSPFRDYVDHCYAARVAGTTELDKVYWKLMMNSLYGKFGQREGMSMIYRDRLFDHQKRAASHANVIWAAYVTSHARLHLLRELRACSTVYYTDTDSLFTPNVRPVSAALGALKHEGTYGVVEFYGNKLYVIHAPRARRIKDAMRGHVCPTCHLDGPRGWCEHAKAKGVPRAAAADFIRLGRAIFRKPARYREARRSFATANVWYDVEKERNELYTKRRVLPSGETEPWEWTSYLCERERLQQGDMP